MPSIYTTSGWGDHIQLLQIYECWHQTHYNSDWCKDRGLQVRGMAFVKDVRKQLCQIMEKVAKGSLDVHTSRRGKEIQQDYNNLRGYANQLAERMVFHNGYRTLGFKPQLVQVHPSSVLKPDDEGKFPNYVVYQELIAATRPYLCTVCAVNASWVTPILNKVNNLNINKLSGGIGSIEEHAEGNLADLPKKDAVTAVPDNQGSKIQAARERFLARKG